MKKSITWVTFCHFLILLLILIFCLVFSLFSWSIQLVGYITMILMHLGGAFCDLRFVFTFIILHVEDQIFFNRTQLRTSVNERHGPATTLRAFGLHF